MKNNKKIKRLLGEMRKNEKIKQLLGEGLFDEFLTLKENGRSDESAYFYTLFLNGYLNSLFSSESMELFRIEPDEREVFGFKSEYGGLFFDDSCSFPEFYELDEKELDWLVNQEIERLKQSDFFDEG